MAIHTTLPIHKKAYDLFDLVIELVKNMPQDIKRTIGDDIKKDSVKIMRLIFRANVAQRKARYLIELIEHLQVIELTLRWARDKKVISTGQYARAIALTDNIGKQATGWRKSSAASPVT
jgi:23S rRNA-intervening sequence protein